ncbi:MAG: molybdenum cofactor guanylyltransferase [Gemmataceae bacterium]
MIRIGGVVLCGGQSSRMGRPKAWLPFGDETLLQRVVRILRSVTDPVVVVSAPGQSLPTLPVEVTVIHDHTRGQGPLEGMATGLAALEGRAEAGFVSSCDVPFLRPAYIRRMIELLGKYAICVPEVDGFRHPLAGIYRVEMAGIARRLLDQGRHRPIFLFESQPTYFAQTVEFSSADPDGASFRNLNTPEEYTQAVTDLAQGYGAD